MDIAGAFGIVADILVDEMSTPWKPSKLQGWLDFRFNVEYILLITDNSNVNLFLIDINGC